MKKNILYTLLFLISSVGWGQTNFNVWGTMVNIQKDGQLYVSGDFVAQDNTAGNADTLATIRNTGFLVIDGDLINYSDSEMFLDEGIPGPIIFDGASDQSITSSRAIYLPSIFMDKEGASNLVLDLDTIRVDSTIRFNSSTSGNILIGNTNVFMETNGLIVGERETSQLLIDSGTVQVEFPTLSGIELEIPHPTIPDSIIFSPPVGLEKENLFGIGWGVTNANEEPKGQDGGEGMKIYRMGSYKPDPATQTQVANGNSALRSYKVEYFEPKSDALDELIFHYLDADIAALGPINQLAVYLSNDNGVSWRKLEGAVTASNDSTNTITLSNVTIVGKDSVSSASNLFVLSDADCDPAFAPNTTTAITSFPAIDKSGPMFVIDICEGDELVLEYNNDNDFEWSFEGIFDRANEDIIIPAITKADSGLYSISLVNNKGCVSSRDVLVRVWGPPPASFDFTAGDICDGDAVTFVDTTPTTEGEIVSYQWDFGDGSNLSILESPTHIYDTAGTYTVTLQVESEHGCLNTTQRTVFIRPISVASFEVKTSKSGGEISTRCSGDAFFFDPDQSIFLDGLQIPTLVWDFGDGSTETFTPAGVTIPADTIPTYGEVTHIYNDVTVDTEYTVTLTSTTSFGCMTVASATVTVFAQPDNSFRILEGGVDAAISCIGTQLTFESAQAVADESSYDYLWSFGDPSGSISNLPNPAFTYNAAGIYTVELTVTRASDPFCSVVSSQMVTIDDTPVSPYPSGSASSCGSSVTLDGNGNGLNGTSSFRWLDNSMVELSTNTTYDVTSASEVPIDLFLEITNPSGCVVTQDIQVSLNTDLNVDLGPDVIACESATLMATSDFPTATYSWSPGGQTSSSIDVSTSGTYTLTVSDGTCISMDEIVVTIASNPIVDLGDDREICEGELYTLNAGTHTSYLWSDGTNGPSLVAGSTGIYWVEVTNASGCSARDSVEVIVRSDEVTNPGEGTTPCDPGCLGAVDASFRMEMGLGPNNSCVGEVQFISAASELDPSAYDFLWDFGDGTNSTEPAPFKTFLGDGTFAVSLTVTSKIDGCSATSLDNFIVHPSPIIPINSTVSTCGSSIDLDAENVGSSYRWIERGTLNLLSTDQVYTVASAGTDPILISLEVTNGFGCLVTRDITVNLNANLDIDLGADIVSCDPVTIGTNEFPLATFLWSTGATTPTIEVTSSGTYSVDVTEPGLGCVSSDVIVVAIENAPIVDLGVDREICEGELFTLNAGSHSSYLWSDGTNGSSLVAGSTGTYWVEVTNGFGCTARDSIFVEVRTDGVTNSGGEFVSCDPGCLGAVDASFRMEMGLGSNETCSSTEVQFISTASEIDPTLYDFFWTFGDGEISTSPAPFKQYVADGIYNVTLTVTSKNDGCNASSSDSFVVYASPQILLGETINTCGSSLELDAGNPGASYRWTDTSTGGLLSTDQLYTVTSTGSTPINLSLGISSADGCSVSSDLTINLNADIDIDLGPDFTACESAVIGSNEFPAASFLWSTGETTPTIEVTSSGTYSVEVTESGAGCISNDEITVTISQNPSPDLGSDITLCFNEVATLSVGSFADYLWSTGSRSSSIDVGGPGTYWVEVTNDLGCIGRDSIVVNATSDPQLEFPDQMDLCSISGMTLEAPFVANRYSWGSSNGFTSSERSITISEIGTYWLEIENECIQRDTIQVIESTDRVEPSFLIPSVVGVGDLVNIVQLTDPLPESQVWAFGDGVFSTQANPIHQYGQVGDYEITLTIFNGACSSSITKNITVVEPRFEAEVVREQLVEILKLKTYPNPIVDVVNVELELSHESPILVRAFTISGLEIYRKEFKKESLELPIDLSGQHSGLYIINVQVGKKRKLLKVIKPK